MANSVDLDEVAHNEPPHQDLRYLQIQLVVSLLVKELNYNQEYCQTHRKYLHGKRSFIGNSLHSM